MKVLAVLDTALDKVLRRAYEFCEDKKELDEFLANRAKAKSELLDAMVAKKADFLLTLMADANYYATLISQGIVDAYALASKGVVGMCMERR